MKTPNEVLDLLEKGFDEGMINGYGSLQTIKNWVKEIPDSSNYSKKLSPAFIYKAVLENYRKKYGQDYPHDISEGMVVQRKYAELCKIFNVKPM